MSYDVAIIGCGRVGLPLALSFADHGLRTLGIEKDEGRLAFFYDTLAALPPSVHAALLAGGGSANDQWDRFEASYRWFREVDDTWKVGTRPFYRPAFDPSVAMRLLDIQEKIQKGGTFAGNEGLPELRERERYLIEKRDVPAGYATAAERGDEDRFGYRLPGGPSRLGVEETR